MNLNEFRNLIENSSDKISVISANSSNLEFTMKELIDTLSEVFSDEEKVQFLTTFKKVAASSKEALMKTISSDSIKLDLLRNPEITNGFYSMSYSNVIESLGEEGLLALFNDDDLLKQSNLFLPYKAVELVEKNFSDESKIEFLSDKELCKKLGFAEANNVSVISSMEASKIESLLDDKDKMNSLIGENNFYYLSQFISKVESEDKRFELVSFYDFPDSSVGPIVESCSDERKIDTILSEEYDFSHYTLENILSKFNDTNKLLAFLDQNGEFIKEHSADIFRIARALPKEKQLEFINGMDETSLPLGDKLKSLVVIDEEVKEQIDRSALPDNYIRALDMPNNYGTIVVDLDSDLSQYQYFDELIHIKPQEFSQQDRRKIEELAKICPNMNAEDSLGLESSTGIEFLEGEKWIRDVLSNIHDDWTDIQKAAYIDYRIGKQVSYTPDFDTEVSDDASARALWKIISSGYGVCNGIAQLEQYMFSHVGIESELVSSGRHSYLKVKNLEIPRSDGTSEIGDTVFDPTWNLTSNRYDAYPNHFARSYEEIRKFDITADGTDKECHRNDEAFNGPTLEIEESVVRDIYKSIGLAKENGYFPISDIMEISDEIAKKDISLEEKMQEQFALLTKYHPEFSTCQNSTISILAGNFLLHDEMKPKKLIVDRVFNLEDKNKRPAVYVYFNDKKEGEKFFVAEEGAESFSEAMSKEEFTKKYECYEYDLRKTEGKRPWERGAKEVEQDLTRSSGSASEDLENPNNKKGDER